MLSRIRTDGDRGEMSKAEDFRAKAVAAELAAQRATDPGVRASYQELARG